MLQIIALLDVAGDVTDDKQAEKGNDWSPSNCPQRKLSCQTYVCGDESVEETVYIDYVRSSQARTSHIRSSARNSRTMSSP